MALWALKFLLILYLFVPLANADILYVEGFDMANEESGTSRDLFGWSETLTSAVDDDMAHVQSTTWCHQNANGGDSSSNGCLYVDTTGLGSGKAAYWKPCEGYSSGCDLAIFPLNAYTVSAHFSLATDNDPSSGSREIFRFIENDATPQGCNVRMGSNREILLYYGSQQLYGGGTLYLDETSCASPYQYIPCVSNGDCPNATCSSNKFQASIVLTEVSSSPTAKCILKINGRTSYDSGVFTPTGGAVPGPIATFWIGAPNSSDTDVAAQYYIDSLVISNDDDLGWGYVVTLTACNNTAPSTIWEASSGSGCSNAKKWECINDYWDNTDTYLIDTGGLVRKTPNANGDPTELQIATGKRKATTTNDYTCSSYEDSLLMCQSGNDIGKVCTAPSDCAGNALCSDALVSGMAVAALSSVVIGDTEEVAGTPAFIFSSGLEWNIGVTPMQVFAHACTSITESATDRELGRMVVGTPVVGKEWSNNDLSSTHLVLRTCDGASNNKHRVSAAAIYAFVTRPGARPPRTIKDANKGTDDGLTVIGFMGDSLFYGTEQVACIGGATPGDPCSQQSHCSWDGTERDKPTGGCYDIDTMCQTCSGRLAEYNSNAGYFCDGTARFCKGHCVGGSQANADCLDTSECPGGTCSKNTCSYPTGSYCVNNGNPCTSPTDCTPYACRGLCDQNDLAWCDTNTDCENLGDCRETGYCEDSCPDVAGNEGICPELYNPAANTVNRMTVDYAINWAHGFLSSRSNYTTYFSNALNGICSSSAGCSAQVGTGRCSCNSTTECGDIGTCAADSTYCPMVSKCCSGTNDAYSACTGHEDCAVGYSCVFPPPDQIVVMIGTNDMLSASYTHPNCKGPIAYGTTGTNDPCACATNTLCTSDAGCPSGGACIGNTTSESTYRCLRPGYGAICTVARPSCWTNTECSGWGNCSTSDYTMPYEMGTCACSTTAQCEAVYGTNYTCVSGLCRYECTNDASCGGISGSCDASTTPDTCKGVCTCPSNSITCATDADCDTTVTSAVWNLLFGKSSATFAGKCVATKCECTGVSTCGEFPPKVCSDTGVTCDEVSDCNAGASCTGQCWYTYGRDFMSEILTKEGKYLNLYYYDAMASDIAALGDGDNKPALVIVPPPLPAANTADVRNAGISPRALCGATWSNHGYLIRVRNKLMEDTTTYPRVINLPEVFESRPSSEVYGPDGCHFTNVSADLVGERIAAWSNANNTCATNTATGKRKQIPQKYCHNFDGTWETTECQSEANCNDDELCEVKVCVCKCSNSYCLYTKKACTVDNDCCYSGATCSGNVCTPDSSACPGTAACNPS